MPPSTPKGSATRDRFLDEAARLLKIHGYHGMGLQQILEGSKAPRGSLYFHFPGGKEQIVAEAIVRDTARSRAYLQKLVAGRGAVEAIELVFQAGQRLVSGSGHEDICPVGMISLECSFDSEILRQACDVSLKGFGALFREPLLKDGAPLDQVDELANLITAAFEGGFVLSRSRPQEPSMVRLGQSLAALVQLKIAHASPPKLVARPLAASKPIEQSSPSKAAAPARRRTPRT